MTPAVCDQAVAPLSKPGFASRLPPVGGGGVVVPQVAPVTEIALKACSTPTHCVLLPP